MNIIFISRSSYFGIEWHIHIACGMPGVIQTARMKTERKLNSAGFKQRPFYSK
jgi:hypothetical protein